MIAEKDAAGPLVETPFWKHQTHCRKQIPSESRARCKAQSREKIQTSRKSLDTREPPAYRKRAISTEPETALPPVHKSSAFIWPVRGNLISRFGKKGEGLRNDGVNIVADRGTLVRAARSGIVAYAENELRGFGNLLLIKHAHGWVTAYAHNETLLVRRGQKVKRGQVVAKVGDSGNVGRPQLHFEIRRGNKALIQYFKLAAAPNRRTANRQAPRG